MTRMAHPAKMKPYNTNRISPTMTVVTKTQALVNLCDAAERGDLKAAREAISQGAAVNGRVEYGKTPVMFAIQNAHVPMIAFLKSAGARLNMLDEDGEHPMIYVFTNNRISVSLDGTETKVTREQQMDVLRTLVLMGADKEARGELGTPALHYAAQLFEGHHIQALVELGMSPLSIDEFHKSTFLHALARNNKITDEEASTLVNMAVASGLDVDKVDCDGKTALSYAKDLPTPAVANALLAAGAQEEPSHPARKRSGPR